MQGSGACWPGPQNLGARLAAEMLGKAAWGPGPQGLGPGPAAYFLLVGAWRRRGCRLKRPASEVGGPGGKRSRDTPYPPPPPTPLEAERKRVFTLSAFGKHPTRPPRSADVPACGNSPYHPHGILIYQVYNPLPLILHPPPQGSGLRQKGFGFKPTRPP